MFIFFNSFWRRSSLCATSLFSTIFLYLVLLPYNCKKETKLKNRINEKIGDSVHGFCINIYTYYWAVIKSHCSEAFLQLWFIISLYDVFLKYMNEIHAGYCCTQTSWRAPCNNVLSLKSRFRAMQHWMFLHWPFISELATGQRIILS